MAIRETFLSAFLEVLFEQMLTSGGKQFLKLVGGVDLPKTIKKWKNELTGLEALLDDAELQQFHSKSVKKWLNDLQDLAYDIEDLLDHFATEAQVYKLKKAEEDEANAVIDHSNAGMYTMAQTIRVTHSRAADSLSNFLKPVDQDIQDKIDEITERLLYIHCGEINHDPSYIYIKESFNSGNDIVPVQQTSSDTFSAILHDIILEGVFSQNYKDSHLNYIKDTIDEHIQHTAFSFQTQFTPLGNGETNLPGTYSFSENNPLVINDGQMSNITFDNNNSQSYDAGAFRHENEITPEPILEQLRTNVDLSPDADKLHDLPSNRRENSNSEGQSIPAIQNGITAVETEQGNCENGQNQILQNDINSKKRENISLEKLQSFWSKNMTLEEAAEESNVSRSTMKRRLKDLGLVWPSNKKGKRHLDARKSKFNNKVTFGSDCSQQNWVNPGNSAAHTKTVGDCITGVDLHALPNHQEQLDNAKEVTLSNTLQQNENVCDFVVKATYNDEIAKFKFSLSWSIDQLEKEVANQLELEANTFNIKYQDEDKEWILMKDIFNLEDALNISRSNNSSVVRLSIFPKI